MSAVLDRIGALYEEQQTLLSRSDVFDYGGAKRQRLQEIAAALPRLWETRRIELSDASETARAFAHETMQANARAIRTLSATQARTARR